MRYAMIEERECVNGSGWGVSFYTQGCPFHCEGCHNPEQWSLDGGQEYTPKTKEKILSLLDKPYITRFSVLGGEPLIGRNRAELAELICSVPQEKDVWLYTGYTLEKLMDEAIRYQDFFLLLILHRVNYIVDGRFEEDKKDITLAFRGSSNQKIWKRKGIDPWTHVPTFEDVTAEFDKNNQLLS